MIMIIIKIIIIIRRIKIIIMVTYGRHKSTDRHWLLLEANSSWLLLQLLLNFYHDVYIGLEVYLISESFRIRFSLKSGFAFSLNFLNFVISSAFSFNLIRFLKSLLLFSSPRISHAYTR